MEELKSGMFTSFEKESILGTIKHIDKRLVEEAHGKSMTLTRPEYDTLMESVRLPNRFLKPEMIEVE